MNCVLLSYELFTVVPRTIMMFNKYLLHLTKKMRMKMMKMLATS